MRRVARVRHEDRRADRPPQIAVATQPGRARDRDGGRGDRAFEQMVVARPVEPVSKTDTPGVLSETDRPGPACCNTSQAAPAGTAVITT